MAGRTALYFAYGSNMSRAQMQRRAGKLLEERVAQLPNYELRFNKKMRGGSGGANIQPASGKTVYGVLYKIEESAFRSMDRYEGVPEHYRRIEVRVTPLAPGAVPPRTGDAGETPTPQASAQAATAQPVSAQVYIAAKVEKGLRPAPHDLQAILEGAAEHGLPESYAREIREAGAA